MGETETLQIKSVKCTVPAKLTAEVKVRFCSHCREFCPWFLREMTKWVNYKAILYEYNMILYNIYIGVILFGLIIRG